AVSPNALRADWWEWMSTYRVWKANRKVFLYPENWIEPALRDDKSPFFEELEADLRRKEITSDVAEEAMARYLAKLVEVAHLDVMAMHHQIEEGDEERPAI